MTVTRIVIALGVAIYVGLWVLALNGASSLVPLLVVPLVLIVLVAGGNWLSSYMGLPGRPQKFHDHGDET